MFILCLFQYFLVLKFLTSNNLQTAKSQVFVADQNAFVQVPSHMLTYFEECTLFVHATGAIHFLDL